jgi:two-component system, NarL family, response regulator NreC
MTARPHLAPATDCAARAESPIRVILADDDITVRRNLRLLLEREDGMEVIAEAADLSAVMRHVAAHVPHVLILDLRMPNGSSIATIRRLRELAPDTEIVVLTMEESPAFAQRALDAGALGFVVKDHADHELPLAVRQAVRGEDYVSPRLSTRLDALRAGGRGNGLSSRETEVLRLIALGHTSAELADKLSLSRRTSKLTAPGSITSSASRRGRSSCATR